MNFFQFLDDIQTEEGTEQKLNPLEQAKSNIQETCIEEKTKHKKENSEKNLKRSMLLIFFYF
jgi:hypothetical protein